MGEEQSIPETDEQDRPSAKHHSCSVFATRESFVARYGGLYEGSPWVAERTFDRRAVAGLDDSGPASTWVGALARAFSETVASASGLEKLALVRAHPDLVGRAALAGELTDDSTDEQASAGLDRCSVAELERFRALNRAYRARFGFPFVMAVRGADRESILQAFERRLGNTPARELATALVEIDRIARLRLDAMHADAAD